MAAQYSIISTSGLHYRDCDSVWEAFRLIRGYSARFVVRRETSAMIAQFDRTGVKISEMPCPPEHASDCFCSRCWDGPLEDLS